MTNNVDPDQMVQNVASDHGLYTSPGPEVIKLYSCSTQLSMRFVLFISNY